MVTEAGKELLRNSINTANFHNKILEQNEMWKQWEMERGLTMMVSDDDILKKIRKNHRCSKHQQMAEGKDWSRSNSDAGTSSTDKWDHSGFQELYPDESGEKRPSSSSVKEHSKKCDREFSSDESQERPIVSSSGKKCKKKHKEKKKKRRYRSEASTSDNEIHQEFKEFKRKRKSEREKLKHSKMRSTGFDNHVKEWKRHKEKFP